METKFTRKLNDLEAALSNFRDALTLEPALFPSLRRTMDLLLH